MTAMPINIDSGAMTAIVSKAILEGIDADQKAALLQQAVSYLVAPSKVGDRWNQQDGPSPLEIAFHRAIEQSVAVVAREVVENDDALQQQIRSLVAAAVADVMAEESTELAEAVRQSLGTTIASFRASRF